MREPNQPTKQRIPPATDRVPRFQESEKLTPDEIRARLRMLRESGKALADKDVHREMVALARRLTGSAA